MTPRKDTPSTKRERAIWEEVGRLLWTDAGYYRYSIDAALRVKEALLRRDRAAYNRGLKDAAKQCDDGDEDGRYFADKILSLRLKGRSKGGKG